MKSGRWEIIVGMYLVILAVVLYVVHFVIFKDPHHIFIFGLGDLAFLPIEVLLVTLIIHRLLGQREKRLRLEKLNMLIGAFFSEVGTELLTYLSDSDPKLDEVRERLIVRDDWSPEEFYGCCDGMRNYDYDIDIEKISLAKLQGFLVGKKDFLLAMLVNPNLLEHETFTGLLQAVFHLKEELAHRENIGQVSEKDKEHLVGDIKRVYGLLVDEWLAYMEHLKNEYPFLFSLAMRTNPFDRESSAEFK
jgi:hypothetical protein